MKTLLCAALSVMVLFAVAPSAMARSAHSATTASAATAQAQAAQASVTLGHVPVGEMSISFTQATRTANTVLNMTGMPPSTSAVALVVAGSCDAPGGIFWRGAVFTADPNGKVVNFGVRFTGVQGTSANSAVVIQTIAGNGETRDGYNLACGIIKTTRIGGSVTQASVTFGPMPGAQNGNVTGSATLAEDDSHALTVNVQAAGLAPSSQHGVTINLGSCTWLSYILYDLPQMTADANGGRQFLVCGHRLSATDQPRPLRDGKLWQRANRLAQDVRSDGARGMIAPREANARSSGHTRLSATG